MAIYDVDSYEINYVNLIANHGEPKVRKALKKINEHRKKHNMSPVILERTSDLPPCGTCGGSSFLRTGNCHVCADCGSSQGCS